jgi:hypothetical protein
MTETVFVVSFLPGVWKRPARWAIHHDDCVFERNSIEEIKQTVEAHMKEDHDVSDVVPTFRYQINGIDITDKVEFVHQKRRVAEEADRQHKIARLEFSNMMRDQGATMASIGQLLQYQLSTVATFLRDKVSKFEKNGE